MKYPISLIIISLSTFLSTSAPAISANETIVRGVNYDPIHSIAFAKAVGTDDKIGMENAIKTDFDKLKALRQGNNGEFKNIDEIKTFFTSYSSAGINGPIQTVNIADVVSGWNRTNPDYPIKLALGVYEFRPNTDACTTESECEKWTQAQIKTAIDAVNKYGPTLITRVIVGNEDILGPSALTTRVATDIKTIQTQTNHTVPVGTAQFSSNIMDMLNNGSSDTNYPITKVADFLGTNLYPFWAGTTFNQAEQAFASYWNTINQIRGDKTIIETEEGWPSAGGSNGKAVASPDNEYQYFQYWYFRDTQQNAYVPISYYFALFDKLPGLGIESHWGIYGADGNANILDGNHSKPLASNHPLISFSNSMDDATVSVNACTTNNVCYPINGFPGSGFIAPQSSQTYMLDNSGNTYDHILVVDKNSGYKVCTISNAVLKSLKSGTKIKILWNNGACGLE